MVVPQSATCALVSWRSLGSLLIGGSRITALSFTPKTLVSCALCGPALPVFGHNLNVCLRVAAAGSHCCPVNVEIGSLVTLISPTSEGGGGWWTNKVLAQKP